MPGYFWSAGADSQVDVTTRPNIFLRLILIGLVLILLRAYTNIPAEPADSECWDQDGAGNSVEQYAEWSESKANRDSVFYPFIPPRERAWNEILNR